MGGVNCNCNGNWISNPQPIVMEQYIEKLACYSELLFAGTAKFFEANASIERSVLSNNHIFTTAIELLDTSVKDFELAKLSIGGVSALHEQLNGCEYVVNFTEQLENITDVISDISAARQMLEKASVRHEQNSQYALWRTQNLTQTFVSAMSRVQQANAWQMDFAVRVRHALLKAA